MKLQLLETVLLRNTLLIAAAGLLVALCRVRSAAVRLAVWRLVLYGSLFMPAAALLFDGRVPPVLLPVESPATATGTATAVIPAPVTLPMPSAPLLPLTPPRDYDWPLLAYASIAALLLLRSATGWWQLRALSAKATPVPELGPDVFESLDLRTPVAAGLFQGRVLLPGNWRLWTAATLQAVLAHERSHLAQRDFLTQCLSKLNRALSWPNPLAWWLDRKLASLAEQVSDDAALASGAAEAPAYAEILINFATRPQLTPTAAAAGVAMARNIQSRIERILDETHRLARPLSRPARAAITIAATAFTLAIGACKVATVSAAAPPQPPQPPSAPAPAPVATHPAEKRRPVIAQYKGKEYAVELDLTDEQQSELTRHEKLLAEKMALLNEKMSALRVRTPEITAQLKALEAAARKLDTQASQEDLARLQEQMAEMQHHLGEAQGKMGMEQAKLAAEQAKLAEQHAKLAAEHATRAREIEKRVREAIEKAIQEGRAKPLE